MDWFQRITGFAEGDYANTQARLAVDGEFLVSRVDGRRHRIGQLETVTLKTLRARRGQAAEGRRTSVNCLAGDARALHARPEFADATFQVASQFNLLEMVGPSVTPEDGVTRYIGDRTQGPACAIAAGAGTIYRNYLVPVGGGIGQTRQRQIDALAPLGEALALRLDRPVASLWSMRNGYALCTADGLAAICRHLEQASAEELDHLRGLLAVGVHRDVAVTDVPGEQPPSVTQVYCSALPIAYSGIRADAWEPFGRLVLEAAYEATLLAAVEQASRKGNPTVLLTRLGGGAFGNPDEWIDAAIGRGLRQVEVDGLDVRLVSYGTIHPGMRSLQAAWGSGAACR
jgi:hypothetical protein